MQKRTARKVAAIREAAESLFRVHGFRRVSLQEVAEAAGVSPVTIYNHFENKAGLVREVMKGVAGKHADEFRKMMSRPVPFLEKLEALMFDKTLQFDEFSGEFMLEVVRDDPHVREWIEKVWSEQINAILQGFFEEGQRLGYVSREITTEALLAYLEIIRRGFLHSPELMVKVSRDHVFLKILQDIISYGLVERKERKRG
jgi:AcrR family transcriptional regulator